MKKFFSIVGFITLVCLSFIYTEKTANLVIDNDQLMMVIKENSANYNIETVDGKIDNNTFIPGINGIEVNNKKSYNAMKKYGIFNSEILEFNQIEPKHKLKDNYDKYIISGNSKKNMISLIFLVDENDNIDDILNILNDKNVKANFFVDGYWFENNNERVSELINKDYVVGNLGYNLDYTDSSFIWMDTIIKRIGKQKQGYCYAEIENEENLRICMLNKDYTIKPNIIIKDNYMKNIKEKLVSGSIISLEINDTLKNELPIIINYINSKGYKIDNLNNLLSEERNY